MTHARGGAANPDAWQDVLQLLPAPVTVIGIHADGQRGGLTAAWVARVSHVPPLLLVSIGHERHSHGLMHAADWFSVSILQEGQVDMARHFGLQSQRDVDKWASVEHVLLMGRTPALATCAGRILCAKRARFVTGDHDCFVGEVIGAEAVRGGPGMPLRGQDYRD